MSPTPSFQPVVRPDDLDRLAVLPPQPDLADTFWTEVHDEVQRQLSFLESEVRRKVADVRVQMGRTKGDRFFLFTYRTFSRPETTLDPVVAGMTWTPAHGEVTIEADVSGEQTGEVIFSLPRITVANSREELLTTARELAGKLIQSAELIAVALGDPSRQVE